MRNARRLAEGESDGAAATPPAPAGPRAKGPVHEEHTGPPRQRVEGPRLRRLPDRVHLRALCAEARPALKGAKFILDVSTESSLTTAARTQNRHELLGRAAHGQPAYGYAAANCTQVHGDGRPAAHGRRAIQGRPRPVPEPAAAPAFRAGVDGSGRPRRERSRRRSRPTSANGPRTWPSAALSSTQIAAGDHAGDITKRAFSGPQCNPARRIPAADEATAAALVEAMGGAHYSAAPGAGGGSGPRPSSLVRIWEPAPSREGVPVLHGQVRGIGFIRRRAETLVVRGQSPAHASLGDSSEAVFREKACAKRPASAPRTRPSCGARRWEARPAVHALVRDLTHERRVRSATVAGRRRRARSHWLAVARPRRVCAGRVGAGRSRQVPRPTSRALSAKTFEDIVIRQEIIGCKENGRVVLAAGGPRRPRVPARRRGGRRPGPGAGRCGGREPVDAGARYDACRRRPSRVRRGRFDDSAERPGRLGHR